MRTALTLGIDKAGKSSVLAGPEVPVDQQRRAFKQREHKGDFAEIQLWESGRGITRRHRTKPAAASSEQTFTTGDGNGSVVIDEQAAGQPGSDPQPQEQPAEDAPSLAPPSTPRKRR